VIFTKLFAKANGPWVSKMVSLSQRMQIDVAALAIKGGFHKRLTAHVPCSSRLPDCLDLINLADLCQWHLTSSFGSNLIASR
jgi:hypothetical protein